MALTASKLFISLCKVLRLELGFSRVKSSTDSLGLDFFDSLSESEPDSEESDEDVASNLIELCI